jgi:MoxR-like ATPase
MYAERDVESVTLAHRQRIAVHVVGRERELRLTLAAAVGREVILERPPGSAKSTLPRAITGEWAIPPALVAGNADLTPSKLIGHHNRRGFTQTKSINTITVRQASTRYAAHQTGRRPRPTYDPDH